MELDGARDTFLTRLNKSLEVGWQCKLKQDGRLYYLNHNNETSHWIPPLSNWSLVGDLPYGWETARDKNGKEYYINHRTSSTTREDPFDLEEAPPEQRDVILVRDTALGFGFIAGSERPVVIRSVTEGGPSIGKLLPGDEILKVNGEDVRNSDRQYIIDKIRYSTDEIALSVIQPYIDKTGLKSSFLSATKKQKLRAKPPRVRFADNVNTFPSNAPKMPPSLVYLPNVLKVYLENGQTKSFKYDDSTTVKEVLVNLKEKLGLKCLEYFSLVVEDVRVPSQHKFIILQEQESLRQIAERPGSQNWKCHLRITYIPCDAYDLLNEDAQAFDYFYQQCCNDVLQERFSTEMKPETVMRLASLHIQQHHLASKQTTKVSLKVIEKDDGLGRFLPRNILSSWKAKELRKMISQHMKQNQNLAAPGQKHMTELQAKLHYLKIFGTLKSFGTRTFLTTILDFPDVDQQSDVSVIIGPHCDISLLAKTGDWAPVLEFNHLTRILLTVECGTEEGVHRLELHQKSGQAIIFLMPSEDAQQMASFINGYYRLLVNRSRTLLTETSLGMPPAKTEAPPYYGKHHVSIAKWNYPDDLVSEVISEEVNNVDSSEFEKGPKRRKTREGEQWVDLSAGPPPYQPDLTYIRNLKMHDRLQNIPELAEEHDTKENVVETLPVEPETEPEVSPVQLDDSSPQSEDSQFSEEKADSEKEEEILSLLSSGASSPESDGSVSSVSGATAIDSNRKSEAKSKKTGKKRDRSLTEGISKKIFRSITGMKFNVKDTVASNDSENVTATEVKFISTSPTQDTSLESESNSVHSAQESPVKDEASEERPNSRLRARDSILIQHRKISPRLERRRDSEDSEVSSENTEGRSNDSDIIDLTNIGDFDFDSDLSPTKSVDAYDDVFLDDEEVSGGVCEMHQVEFHVGSDPDDNISPGVEGDSEMLALCNESDVELDLPGFDNDDDDDDDVDKDENKMDNHREGDYHEEEVDDVDDIPVSVIDTVSPEPTLTSPMDTSDEAHGMQLAALVALNASLEEPTESLQAAAKSPDNECESDSGNETISSEIDNNNTEHTSVYQSPRDYASFDTASNFTDSVDLVEPESSSTTSLKDEDIHEPYGCAAGCATSSDTESTSTLHGSSPNLSAIDMHIGEDRAPSVQHRNIDDVLPSLAAPETSAGVGGFVDDIEALIATLAVQPPPLFDSGEIDEELLQAILPPPPLEGFDEGAIESAFPQMNLSEGDEDEKKEIVNANIDFLKKKSCELDKEEDRAVRELATSLDLLKMPSPGDEPDMSEVLDTSTSIKTNNEMNLSSSLPDPKDCEGTFGRNAEQDSGDDDEEDKDLDSDLGDLEEEAGLRELLELTLSNAIGSIHHAEPSEFSEEGFITPSKDVRNHLEWENNNDVISEMQSCNETEENQEELTPRPNSLNPDNAESDGDEVLKVQYDSYGQLRGHGSPEEKVANILDAIISGGISPNVSSSSNLSTPSYDKPLNSPHDLYAKPRGIQQSKLQGSVDSGFHQPDQDQISVTSPSETSSVTGMDNNYSGILDALVMSSSAHPTDGLEDKKIQESTTEKMEDSNAEKPVVRPKIMGGKPSVPPKPPKPARPKDLQLKLGEYADDTGLRKSNKYPAPQPPQPPPRKRYKAPSIAAKASRFENTNVYKSHEKGSPERFATLPKSFAPPPDIDGDIDSSQRPELTRLHSDVATYGGEVDVQEKQKRGKPVTRSHTFSDSSPTKDSSIKPTPLRKAPPAPLPKPKKTSGVSPTSSGKSSPRLSQKCPSASTSPSLSKKQSFTGSLSRLLTPKNKTWGQFKDALPFKQGSFKGNSSSRSKSKSRKPLKALWPSATCDTPEDVGNTTKEVSENLSYTLEKGKRGMFQRSESAEFNTKPDYSLEVRARSFSMNLMRSNSEDSTSESDMETPKGSPNLRQGGTLKERPSSMISLTESYPPPFYHPRRPPPPRPSNPPVLKAASLSKLSTRMYVQTGPISPIPPSPVVSPEPVSSPDSSFDTDTEVSSPTPPPLPTTNPPDFSKPEGDSSPVDDQYCNGNSNANLIMDIESRDYDGEAAISRAIQDIELLADDMRDSISTLESQPNSRQFRQTKESLLAEVREFTSNTKMVVSAAGQPGQQLKDCTNSSMHTLARLCSATQASMDVMSSTPQAKNLGRKVEDVARNFGATLGAASEAHGKPMSDPRMQQLLRKAQTMAALLSALMRSLRMLQH